MVDMVANQRWSLTTSLDRQFEVDAPDTVWVTDITYIKTHEGWSHLSVVH